MKRHSWTEAEEAALKKAWKAKNPDLAALKFDAAFAKKHGMSRVATSSKRANMGLTDPKNQGSRPRRKKKLPRSTGWKVTVEGPGTRLSKGMSADDALAVISLLVRP